MTPGAGMSAEEQAAEFGLLGRLNRLSGIDYPDDPACGRASRPMNWPSACRPPCPRRWSCEKDESTQALYGFDQDATRSVRAACLAARRLVERGVRFVQIFHGGGGGGAWDAHGGIRANHDQLSAQVDLPIAGLLKDLKRRGMLEETLVVWGTEFGRSPGAQGDGRDHHPQGFCAWLAGGGIKGGVVHGATDEIGFHAVEHRHYVTDIHATVLHQLGLDPRQLEVPGRKRLEIDYGQPIREIIAYRYTGHGSESSAPAGPQRSPVSSASGPGGARVRLPGIEAPPVAVVEDVEPHWLAAAGRPADDHVRVADDVPAPLADHQRRGLVDGHSRQVGMLGQDAEEAIDPVPLQGMLVDDGAGQEAEPGADGRLALSAGDHHAAT